MRKNIIIAGVLAIIILIVASILIAQNTKQPQDQITTFLRAKVGLAPIVGGVVNDQITQGVDRKYNFKIRLIRPEKTFDVTLSVKNDAQQFPDIVISEAQ